MNFARTCLKGIIFCDTRRSYNGITMFSPVKGDGIYFIKPKGELFHVVNLSFPSGSHAVFLPDGNILVAVKKPSEDVAHIEGATGIILILDADGGVIWEYRDPYLHHGICRLRNGNTLVMKWVPVPDDVAGRVHGGDPFNGVMWGDIVQELTPHGKVVWEWNSLDYFLPELIDRCPFCPRDTMLHMNSVNVLPDENLIVSFAKINTIAIIDKKNKSLKWQWGSSGELAHQHAPYMLSNGNILLFDNGLHPVGLAQNFSRVLEINPKASKMVWSFDGPENGELRMLFYSSLHSNCQRLPNNNTLVCEGMTGRIFELTHNGDMVWEYVNPFAAGDDNVSFTRSFPVYGATRYSLDYPGLRSIA